MSTETVKSNPNSYLARATRKRQAYINAGYTCTDLDDTGTAASFIATDVYGVSRTHIFGEDPTVTTPIIEKAKENKKRKSKKVEK